MSETSSLFGSKPTLSLAAARALIAAAEVEAVAAAARVSIAVLDDGGHLIAFSRMDGIHAATVEVATAKARAAVMFRRPTKAFSDMVAAIGPAVLALPGVIPFEGGVPILVEGALVGGVGVSGSAADVDGRIARAGIAAILPEAGA
ncbi:GlcG/HbpS family heme-binding protein [Prosthecomicrobium pneumaticum]|uniref:Uncharacterized protein GlcG (DUF336 family) n=1 Tax=Prosthecomicrobium pneumaticum TaxID=81895 RepID=A0A7W9L3S7_9HYPH|nr:heme-binding protein [Prosthecomicrobium pneumaticum]MBB5754838.1 uncharacterized protein GlcG (DUF336 family) [Prosthecomicrobium pneumaticum]